MGVATVRLAQVVEALGGDLVGSGDTPLQGLASLATAQARHIGFVTGAKHAEAMRASQAGALIVTPALAEEAAQQAALIVTPDPYLYYARLSQWWQARLRASESQGVHPSASVHPDARLGAGVGVGPFAVIEAGAEIGAGARIGAHCVIEAGASVGARSRIAPQVVLGADCSLGADCIVHSGTVIGADGFGFAPSKQGWVKIEQLGAVRIGDAVEIGANCCIDRGALDDTVIEEGCKLDNFVHIAHNVVVGAHTVMAGCASVAGSARIGRNCLIGGDAKINGHITLVDGVQVSACTMVMRSVSKPGVYTGIYPFEEHGDWERTAASLRGLPKLRERVRALERKEEKS